MAGTKTIDELINQFQEPIDTGKSIDDIIQQSNLIEALAPAVSTGVAHDEINKFIYNY